MKTTIQTFLILGLFLIGFNSCNTEKKNDEVVEEQVEEPTDDTTSSAEEADDEGGIKITAFVAGKKLSLDDIGFLAAVITPAGENARGEVSEVDFNGTMFTEGYELSEEEAKEISEKIGAFSKENMDGLVTKDTKAEVADGSARGCGYFCYYWYWDAYCGCYYKYWYWCCL